MDPDKAQKIRECYGGVPRHVADQRNLIEMVYGAEVRGRRVDRMSGEQVYSIASRIISRAYSPEFDLERLPDREVPDDENAVRRAPADEVYRGQGLESIDSKTLGLWAAEMRREESVSEDEKTFSPDDRQQIIAELFRRRRE